MATRNLTPPASNLHRLGPTACRWCGHDWPTAHTEHRGHVLCTHCPDGRCDRPRLDGEPA